MKAIAVFLLFVGMFLVVQGYYYQKQGKCPPPQVQVKYIPKTLYEEQLSAEQQLSAQFRSMFEGSNPWPTDRDSVTITPLTAPAGSAAAQTTGLRQG